MRNRAQLSSVVTQAWPSSPVHCGARCVLQGMPRCKAEALSEIWMSHPGHAAQSRSFLWGMDVRSPFPEYSGLPGGPSCLLLKASDGGRMALSASAP
jgi:hypothetical protein